MSVVDQADVDLGGWPMSNRPARVLPLTNTVRRAWGEELPPVDALTGAWWTRRTVAPVIPLPRRRRVGPEVLAQAV
jgi:hypothetical protein